MSVLPKGTLTAIVATMVASTLILMNGNSVADSVDKTVKPVSSEINIKEPKDITNKIVKTTSKEKGGVKTSLPPPGPFMGPDTGGKDVKVTKDSARPLLEPTLPKGIIKKPALTLRKPNVKEAPLNNRTEAKQPILTSAAPEFKRTQPSIPMGPVDSLLAPALKQIAPEEPKRKVLNLTQETKKLKVPVQPKQLAKPNVQPIWMQKPPVNASVEPVRPPAGKIKQQYMYIPVPMYQPNNIYPQIPPNGNYYYPPVTNFGFPQAPVRGNYGVQKQVPNTPKHNKGVTK